MDEAYLRASWQSDDLLVGVRGGEVVVHAGGIPVLIEPMAGREAAKLTIQSLRDDGVTASVRCADATGHKTLEITLNRPQRKLTIRRRVPGDWSWWCHGNPVRRQGALEWPKGARLQITTGQIVSVEPNGYGPRLATGFLKLQLADPAHRTFPKATLRPAADGAIEATLTLAHEH